MLTLRQISGAGPEITSELQSPSFPLAQKYLRDRGVTPEMMDDLGIQIRAGSELGNPREDRIAVIFAHFNTSGDYIDWWSARFIDGLRPVVHSVANLVPHRRNKTFCPANEPPHAYLVPTKDWAALKEGDRIYIHESCLKAIAGAQCGKYSIGLNGVWGWGSKKHSVGLVEEIRQLPWKDLKLQPVIVFDSNAVDNWGVKASIPQLAARIQTITTRVAVHILLPKREDGGDQGFDDYFVSQGVEAATAFLDQDGEPIDETELAIVKAKLNNEVCVVRSLKRVAEQKTGTLMTKGEFTDVNYAHYVAHVEDKFVNVPKAWLSDEKRVEVDTLDYLPGGDKIVVGDNGVVSLNLWKGLSLEPRDGDVSRWLQLLDRNIPDEALRRWVIQWLAYPLQHLGEKLNTFLHLYGPPGSGKQAVLHPLRLIYGENFVKVGKRELTSDFNSIYANKQFINFDELQASDTSDVANQKLKMLTTDDRMPVNTKGQPEYLVRNCANICTTGNYADSIKLDDDDRRACVIKFGARGVANDEQWWTDYYQWLDEKGGAEAVFYYLLGVDMDNFNPKGWAPMTEEKRDVTQASRSPVEQWVSALWAEPDDVLAPNLSRRALFTNEELAMYAYGDDPVGVTPGKKNSLGIKMSSAGFARVELKVEKRKVRFWVVRGREEEWTPELARIHLKKHAFPGV